MEREGQEPSDAPSQTAGEGQDQMTEKRKVIMAVTEMLDSGTLDERSSQLLEQLADYIQHPPTEVAHGTESDEAAAIQPAAPPRGESMGAESSEETKVGQSPDGTSKGPAEERAFVGSLRTTPEDRWTCKVSSCTGKFHRLKDCR
jgi:hypothetical protein